MKKQLATLLIISLLAVGFAGCASEETPAANAPGEASGTAPIKGGQASGNQPQATQAPEVKLNTGN